MVTISRCCYGKRKGLSGSSIFNMTGNVTLKKRKTYVYTVYKVYKVYNVYTVYTVYKYSKGMGRHLSTIASSTTELLPEAVREGSRTGQSIVTTGLSAFRVYTQKEKEGSKVPSLKLHLITINRLSG